MKKVFAVTAAIVLLCLCSFAQASITIPTVPVSDPGNAADTHGAGYGAVGYGYKIGTYEVTAGQYTAFLNKVATTDSYGLYNASMWSSSFGCKIQRSGTAGSYTYSVAADWANRPVNYVSWGDSARFANWLHNGQPTGLQSALTTEDGAYYLNGATTNAQLNAVNREADWRWAITSEDEWHKAAYYKGGSTNAGYWDYPMQSDVPTVPSNDLTDPDGGNNANFYQSGYTIGSPYYRTNVGEFENSESAYGTFDQGGNVWEWNESIVYQGSDYVYRGFRGGSFGSLDFYLQASSGGLGVPSVEDDGVGFRVSQVVPEPSSLIMLGSGILALAGIIRRRNG